MAPPGGIRLRAPVTASLSSLHASSYLSLFLSDSSSAGAIRSAPRFATSDSLSTLTGTGLFSRVCIYWISRSANIDHRSINSAIGKIIDSLPRTKPRKRDSVPPILTPLTSRHAYSREKNDKIVHFLRKREGAENKFPRD